MNRKWYVLRTIPSKELEAAELMVGKLSHTLWQACRILKKQQLFRTQADYLLSRKGMFPGYLFICTDSSQELAKELKKTRRFLQLTGSPAEELIPIEDEDLKFLEHVCGKDLEHDMRLSTVRVDEQGHVQSARDALKPYIGRITRQRRHRYVTAEVPLFNRRENVLFGIRLDGDPV